jgi:hypothetical protein
MQRTSAQLFPRLILSTFVAFSVLYTVSPVFAQTESAPAQAVAPSIELTAIPPRLGDDNC